MEFHAKSLTPEPLASSPYLAEKQPLLVYRNTPIADRSGRQTGETFQAIALPSQASAAPQPVRQSLPEGGGLDDPSQAQCKAVAGNPNARPSKRDR
jgi:hypothetical protein